MPAVLCDSHAAHTPHSTLTAPMAMHIVTQSIARQWRISRAENERQQGSPVNTEQNIEFNNTEQTIENEHLRGLLNKAVHITFRRTLRANLNRNFAAFGSVRIDAVDGVIVKLSSGCATIEVENVYSSHSEFHIDPSDLGLRGYAHRCTMVQPLSYLGAVVAAAE